MVCDTTGNTVRRVLLHLSRDRGGGYFGRVTKRGSTVRPRITALHRVIRLN